MRGDRHACVANANCHAKASDLACLPKLRVELLPFFRKKGESRATTVALWHPSGATWLHTAVVLQSMYEYYYHIMRIYVRYTDSTLAHASPPHRLLSVSSYKSLTAPV
jgi:hypothetical protein